MEQLLVAIRDVVNGDDPRALDRVGQDKRVIEGLSSLSESMLPGVWGTLLKMAPHQERALLHILVPLDDREPAMRRANVLARCHDTWSTPGLMETLEDHMSALGVSAVRQTRDATETAALHSTLKESSANSTLAQDMLDRLWSPSERGHHATAGSTLVTWTVLLRMMADQPEGVAALEDLEGVTHRAEGVLTRLLGHGFDLEMGGTMDLNGQDVSYESALHAACLILENTLAGKTAVGLLINHGANVDRVLALDIGAASRQTIESHPKLVARRLETVAQGAAPAIRKRAKRHI